MEHNVCCICSKTFEGYRNNPKPVKDEGVCCDYCNAVKVIPSRLIEDKAGLTGVGSETVREIVEEVCAFGCENCCCTRGDKNCEDVIQSFVVRLERCL